MRRKLFAILFAACLLSIAHIGYAENLEMKTYEVTRVSEGKDPDEWITFELSDGSLWYRTWWEEPVYNVEVGQKVAIIPMTANEAPLHSYAHLGHPSWIVLTPREDVSIVAVAFRIN